MDGLKQRVIGALVLVSLAVIFVPMLFDEPHSERSSRVIDLPEEPPFPEVDLSAPPVEEPVTQSYRLEEVKPAGDGTTSTQAVGSNTANEPVVEVEPTRPAEPQPAPAPVVESQPATPAPTTPPVEQVSSADYTNSLEGAWIVQMGSFGNADNARRLRDQAREKGYSSHLQEITRGDTVLTRVFCGPFAEKSEAERAKHSLDSAFGINSLVTSGAK